MAEMTRILLVNGPPRSGKDAAGRMIRDATGASVCKFAESLKVGTHGLFSGLAGCPDPDTWAAEFESVKDRPRKEFFGKTPREAYIAVSELLCKPLFGEHFFGHVLADQIEEEGPEFVVVTDSGFEPEAQVLVQRFGADHVKVLRLYRQGCDFSSDSRGYIRPTSVEIIELYNDGTLEQLRHRLCIGLLPRIGWAP
jgi:hypothetical protein